ncbi:MAG: hypothetical protein H0V26_01000 [Solirubrobacterales bacterium]|nr:hypothetical protein [Solirubrobacterales bacterium]
MVRQLGDVETDDEPGARAASGAGPVGGRRGSRAAGAAGNGPTTEDGEPRQPPKPKSTAARKTPRKHGRSR